MEKNRKEEQELIERYAFLTGKKATREEIVASFEETAEEMNCFSF